MSITLDNALQLATIAKTYARSIILKSSTYHTVKPDESRPHYGIGIIDIRKSAVTMIDALVRSGVDKDLAIHESRAVLTKKFSLGNCHELAVHALDYLINDTTIKEINAELYYLHGGDHVFLVINRATDSDPSKPETWGENAVICDPWFDLVFPASEYKHQLKNHKRINGQSIITAFDSDKHACTPILNHNLIYLKHAKATAIFKITVHFKQLAEKSLADLREYHARLTKQERILAMRHRTQKRKIKIAARIQALDCQIKNITSLIQTVAAQIEHSETMPIHESIKLANHTLITIRTRVNSLLNQSLKPALMQAPSPSSTRHSR